MHNARRFFTEPSVIGAAVMNLWDSILPPGTIDIHEPIVVPPGESIRGSGRKTILRSSVPAGEFALKFEGVRPQTGGEVRDLTIDIVTPRSGGISAVECQSVRLSNLLIKSAKNPVRLGSDGIKIDGKRNGSAYCRIDFVDIFLCDVGVLLDTTDGLVAFSNRHTITALRCWQCGVGVSLAAASTNWIQAAFESCDKALHCGWKSARNYAYVVEEKSQERMTIGLSPSGNVVDGIHGGYERA